MGTYYKAVNTSRREFIEPSTFGQTGKVQEFTEEPAGIMEALALLLLEGRDGDIEGRWAGDNIIFASVYGKEDDRGYTLYHNVRHDLSYENIGPQVIHHMAQSSITKQRLIERAQHSRFVLQATLDELGIVWREEDQDA